MTPREHTIECYTRALELAAKEEMAGRRGQVREVERYLARTDLFYLLTAVLGRRDINRDWIFDRCREVEAAPDGYLDLWARDHFKSSIITYGLTIQEILKDPEITVGILSVTRPTSKAFLRQIKFAFENNERLRSMFSDILWQNPHRDSPKWSEDDGIIVRRKGNPKESTVEAHGLVDGQPTSKHFKLLVYDDVVTDASVSTPEMIEKVTRAWENSRNLSTEGGKSRYIGTRWHYADTYRSILERGAATERRHPVTVDGTVLGEPVLWSRERVAEKRREMGPYVFAAQMLLDPSADRTQSFMDGWIKFYQGGGDFGGMNKYLLVDPAGSKEKSSDYTAMAVIGLGSDQNYYLLDAVRDRLSLRERGDALFALHRRWRPRGVGYEQYGMASDIEYLKLRMAEENYRFDIEKVGGRVAKEERIKRLVPLFEAGRFLLPETLIKVDYEGRHVDLVQNFINEEYKPFPVGLHDDLFDAMARIWDVATVWPKSVVREADDRYARGRARQRAVSAWAA